MWRVFLAGLLIILLYSDCGILSSKDNTQKDDISPFVNISQYKLPSRLDFCGEPLELDNPIMRERAEREFLINLQSPGQIILYLKRSGRYFPIFDSIFKQYNIPDDLKYLAVAESGLQNVMSPKQAYGIWQFIPTTAKEYNLQVDEYVDERLNIYKSTEAACKYLQRAYEVFGSWTLAACAYNMGFANLSNNIDFQSTRNFYELFLNEETSGYIFRIAVLKEILINHRKYGFDLSTSEIYKPFKTKQIVWNEEIQNLAIWAKAQGTSYLWVKVLNPWILKRSLPKPKTPYVIEIPVDEK